MGKELITEEFKMMVVQYVLEDHTWKEVSEKFGVSCTPIEKWVNLYKLHGTEGLLSRNLVGRQKGFDSEFRLKVLQYKWNIIYPADRNAFLHGCCNGVPLG